MNDTALRVYLNDHLAGAIFGSQNAQSLLEHSDGALAEFLRDFLSQLREERAIVVELLALIGAPVNPVKLLGATVLHWLAELKLRRRFVAYDAAARFNALESLCLGVEGKRLLWRALLDIANHDVRLVEFDFRRLCTRASEQEAALRLFRLQAAAHTFHRLDAPILALES